MRFDFELMLCCNPFFIIINDITLKLNDLPTGITYQVIMVFRIHIDHFKEAFFLAKSVFQQYTAIDQQANCSINSCNSDFRVNFE